jgi:BolA protein
MVQTELVQRLQTAYPESQYWVENESSGHNVPAGSETHFKITLVSDAFCGVRKVQRHQAMYKLVDDLLAGPVHALALHLYTHEEWASAGAVAPDSPDCLGGSKRGA